MGWLYDKAPKKRRRIATFTDIRIATKDHVCVLCEETIYATSQYQFDVFAQGSTLVAEKTHLWPECPK